MSDNEYTPTTEHVRAQYARQENYDEFYEGDLYDTPDGQVSAAEFDRWLAAHDREVAAKSWDEGALWAAVECASIDSEANAWLAPGDNPYRTALGVPVGTEREADRG